jgi:hypothetical protein
VGEVSLEHPDAFTQPGHKFEVIGSAWHLSHQPSEHSYTMNPKFHST